MENDKHFCYITYAIPLNEMPQIPIPGRASPEIVSEMPPYPKGFMPSWFQNGSFPEDDID